MIFDARSSSRRWMTVTFVANFVRKIASSMAESPPPTTAIGLLAEEEAVAGGAGGDAVAEQLAARTREPEHPRRRAGRDDDRLGAVLGVADPHPERARREVDAVGVGGDELGAEALGLLAELHHELGAHDPVGEAGVVLDVGGEHQLPAGADALDDDRARGWPGRRRRRRSARPGRNRR